MNRDPAQQTGERSPVRVGTCLSALQGSRASRELYRGASPPPPSPPPLSCRHRWQAAPVPDRIYCFVQPFSGPSPLNLFFFTLLSLSVTLTSTMVLFCTNATPRLIVPLSILDDLTPFFDGWRPPRGKRGHTGAPCKPKSGCAVLVMTRAPTGRVGSDSHRGPFVCTILHGVPVDKPGTVACADWHLDGTGRQCHGRRRGRGSPSNSGFSSTGLASTTKS